MKTKPDRSVQYTKIVLKGALSKLIDTKNIDKIKTTKIHVSKRISILENSKGMAEMVFRDSRSLLVNKVIATNKILNYDETRNSTPFTCGENGAIAVLTGWVL